MARKIVVDVPDDMYQALVELKSETGVPISNQVRLSLQKSLAKKGKKVSADVGAWGGNRDKPKKQTA
jgi:hypothetical protein